VLWRCWLGSRKVIRPVKKLSGGVLAWLSQLICLERGADLHMAQLMPMPLTVSCFSKIQIGYTFLVLAHPGSPGLRAVKCVCVCMCVCVCVFVGSWESSGKHLWNKLEGHISRQRSVRFLPVHISCASAEPDWICRWQGIFLPLFLYRHLCSFSDKNESVFNSVFTF